MLICLPCFIRIVRPLLKKENGLSEQEIEGLEIIQYHGYINKNDDNMIDNNSCVICLDTFTTKDEVIHFSCKHIFHAKCVKERLLINGSCPICRIVVQINTDINV